MSEEKKKIDLKKLLEKSKGISENRQYINLEKKAMAVNKPTQALLDSIETKPKKKE
jgi:AmiR/NasT family two-component response regulator